MTYGELAEIMARIGNLTVGTTVDWADLSVVARKCKGNDKRTRIPEQLLADLRAWYAREEEKNPDCLGRFRSEITGSRP